ncbi:double-strand break repair helicase AddA [Tardibacter chloracetimidivorans]|uniref:DNA 3'-5' helicase n=1 Tax=Tardibacter chloracetimidivorans TaxID=1921510 RepID=A0A1L3ZYN8_9SPHN|nr:double-strand break repair helicase AddA [Tardibacter chloracetimidivorans]API60742.1 double-strand break repair helicase AddA [Tardibacter chloracetimidivorans]
MADARKSYPLLDNQAVAADPRKHAWVSASAGTGKTQVLTARVLRLLLNGADPAGILCITFTKAGAAEMAERLNGVLARWVRCPDKELRQHLFNLGEPNDDQMIARARTLFARVLEAAGGLRIETIHAFAQSLLAAFPMESGVAPGFAALDERSTEVLKRRVLAEVLVEAERTGDPILDDFRAISVRMGDGGKLMQMLGRMTNHAAALQAFRSREEITPRLRRFLDVPEDVDGAMAAACADSSFPVEIVRRIAAANAAWATKTGLTHADVIAAWLAASPADRARLLPDLLSVACTKDGKLRAVQKGQRGTEPEYASLCERLHDSCSAILDLRARADLAEWLGVTLRAGWQVAQGYAAEKERQGVIDYGDMIERAAALLSGDGMGAWVRYKLDQKLDHILIDEAQDTNRAQWTIASRLTEEFFAGEGARGLRRTVFAVGDFKQAIFSFQGTDPREFDQARQWFDGQVRQSGGRLHDLDLAQSFRSTGAVLDVVNRLIADLGPEAFGLDRGIPLHQTSRTGEAGQVILLPPTREALPDEDDQEDAPEGEEEWVGGHERLHAQKLARQIAEWVDPVNPFRLEAKGRPLKAEDILVLVRSRGDFTALLVARLHEEGVAVAGVDRLRLTAPLAVQDMLALIRFALQPGDDLTLATLLVSPLIGLSQDQLLTLAHDRRGGLWRRLRQAAETDPAMKAAADWLLAVLAMADFAAPYEFLETVLSGPLDGRRWLLRRLGEEARDPLDELLNAALAFEAANLPSLQGFLDWVEREDVEVKRDPSAPRDAVRIMTVHGSKGLQAPLVVLADATKDPDRNAADHAMVAMANGALPLPLHCSPKEARGPVAEAFADAAERARQEHWRLAYVAMTRAEDVLVVSGSLGPRARGQVPDASWYAAAARAMEGLEADGVPHPGWGEMRVYRTGKGRAAARKPRAPLPLPVLPEWVHASPPPEQAPPRPLAPSSLGEDSVTDPPLPPAAADAARRGSLLHGLFERLPAAPPARRRDLAEQWLSRPGREPDSARRAVLVDAAMRVIDDPAFADIFAPDALAEAPVAAVVGETVVAGTVDRLLVTDGHVRVIDFKTGSRVPAGLAEVPVYHLRQMAAYVAALETVFPGRLVEAALLYTSGPRLIRLEEDVLSPHRPMPRAAISG